jgi:hypothetical protein
MTGGAIAGLNSAIFCQLKITENISVFPKTIYCDLHCSGL